MTSWDPAERDRVAALCEEHGVHTVECVIVDTWGMPRGKRIPVRQFLRGSGYHIANVIYVWDPTCFIFPAPFVDETDGFPDMHAVPDLSSFRIAGWTDGVAIVMCDTIRNDTHEPVEMDARMMLKRQLARAADMGFGVDAATELECHFFTEDWKPIYDDINCYSIYRGFEMEPFMLDIRESLRMTGIEVEATNVEYGPGQTEINLRYGPLMDMADHTVYFKYIVRLVAKRHGLNVTFMAKPFLQEAGNGMHVHQSLTRDGRNVFAEQDEDSVLGNSTMRRYLTGLLQHHKELQLVMTPTISGYKRLQDYSFSPTQVTWGLDHRLVGVRSIVGSGPVQPPRGALGRGRRQPVPRAGRRAGRGTRRARERLRPHAPGRRATPTRTNGGSGCPSTSPARSTTSTRRSPAACSATCSSRTSPSCSAARPPSSRSTPSRATTSASGSFVGTGRSCRWRVCC